jgi:hypothetical protein
MKINELLVEGGKGAPLRKSHAQTLDRLQTLPGLNMNTGDAYKAYRFGVALAGAPEIPTDENSPFAGNYTVKSYTDEEQDMIKYAAKQMGVGIVTKAGKGSKEPVGTNTASPVATIKKNKYGV